MDRRGILVLLAAGMAAAVAAGGAAAAPVLQVRTTLGAQQVALNGVVIGRHGAVRFGSDVVARAVAPLGTPTGCRADANGFDVVTRWRAPGIIVRHGSLMKADCDGLAGHVALRVVLTGPTVQLRTEHGRVRVGGRMPAAMAGAATSRPYRGGRSYTWPLEDFCDGSAVAGYAALTVVTSAAGRVTRVTAVTGSREPICDP